MGTQRSKKTSCLFQSTALEWWKCGTFMGVHAKAFKHISGFDLSVSAAINSRRAHPVALAELCEKYLRYTGRNAVFNNKYMKSAGMWETSESLMTGGFRYTNSWYRRGQPQSVVPSSSLWLKPPKGFFSVSTTLEYSIWPL